MWIKICGIRDVQTAMAVCELAPDAIGLNFYTPSVRSVSREEAVRIANAIPAKVERVGVFVNHPVDEIERLVTEGVIQTVQLHGDETPRQIEIIRTRLPDVRLLRAWRMDGDSLDDFSQHLADCRSLGVEFSACLIDSRVKGSYGGTGHTVSWSALKTAYQYDVWPPLIVAGGLTSENVATAIKNCHSWGVDTASGVESAPGVKDIELVRRFIKSARS